MKVRVNRDQFHPLLTQFRSIVTEKRNAAPLLSNLLFEAKDNRLTLSATDSRISLVNSMKAEVLEPGRAAVSGSCIFNVIKEMPDGTLLLEKQENFWIRVTQEKSVFNIFGLDPEQCVPVSLSSEETFTEVDSSAMEEMIEKTLYSVANDEASQGMRYNISGVFLEEFDQDGQRGHRMVGTDGHRLSVISRKIEGAKNVGFDKGVIIPRKGLAEIKKLLEVSDEPLSVALQKSSKGNSEERTKILLRQGTALLAVQLVEATFPDYKQFFPKEDKGESSIRMKRESLYSVLKRVSLLSEEHSKGVIFSFTKGKMEITSSNLKLGDAREEVPVDYTGEGLKVGFNAQYVLDALSKIEEEEIDLKLRDQVSPGLVQPAGDKDYTCLIMPIRV